MSDSKSQYKTTHDLLAHSLNVLNGKVMPNSVIEVRCVCRSAEGFAFTHEVSETVSEENDPAVQLRKGQ